MLPELPEPPRAVGVVPQPPSNCKARQVHSRQRICRGLTATQVCVVEGAVQGIPALYKNAHRRQPRRLARMIF